MFTNPNVFPVETGEGVKYCDPLRVWRHLTFALGEDPNKVLADLKSPDPTVAFTSRERIYKAARFAFELPFDETTGQGATEDVLNKALRDFRDYLQKKKMSTGN